MFTFSTFSSIIHKILAFLPTLQWPLSANNPLLQMCILSLTFAIPAIIYSQAREGIISHEIFPFSTSSSSPLVKAYSLSIGISLPLIIDFLLNSNPASVSTMPFKDHRIRAVLLLFISSSLSLGSLDFQSTAIQDPILLTCFAWSYFTSIAILFSILHLLSPILFNRFRYYVCLTSCFIFLFALLLSTLFNIGFEALRLILIISFALYALCLSILSFLWLRFKWNRTALNSIPIKDSVTFYMLLLLCIDCISFAFLFLPSSSFSEVKLLWSIAIRSWIVLCIYILPARLLKSELAKKHNLVAFKTELVKFVSHELRSPLNVVSINSELLTVKLKTNALLSNLVKEDITEIKESCNRCIEVLDNLMLYEKIESNSLELQLKIYQPNRLLSALLKPYQSQAVKMKLHLEYDMAFGSSVLLGLAIDIEKIKLVLSALLLPALRTTSTTDGSLVIHLETQRILTTSPAPSHPLSMNSKSMSTKIFPLQGNSSSSFAVDRDNMICIRILDTKSQTSVQQAKDLLHYKFQFDREYHSDESAPGFR